MYKIRDDLALVQTVDYFTPIVDDAYAFGQIAAANALSDVYAMGGVPITVLNIVGYPITKLPKETLSEILRGGRDKVLEAGAVILGGHSIDDKDPKFGLAVTGTVHPDRIWTNSGARPGDALVLTKPIGAGVMTTGIKRGIATEGDIETITKVMSTLNKTASEIAKEFSVHACTDVTGFGFLGHALEMAKGSGVHLSVELESIPILPQARYFAEQGAVPGGTKRNLAHVLPDVLFDGVGELEQTLLADSITSGGLLISLPASEAKEFVLKFNAQGVSKAAVVAKVEERRNKPFISVYA